jgi:membrane protease YdiL (CAAX protease family)
VNATAAPTFRGREAISAQDVVQHALPRSVALHLLPGFAGLAMFLLTAPFLAAAGWPPLFAFYGPMSVTILAVEGGYLWRLRRRHGSAADVDPVIAYRRRLRVPAFVGLSVGLVLIGLVLTSLLSIVDGVAAGSLFAGLPSWWLVTDPSAIVGAPGGLLVATLAVGFVMNGFVGPIVEEAYFRGHLLPRISRFGWRAPVLNAVLFSLYHFWQPWALVSRLGYVLPYAFAVKRTRSIYVGMAVHCTANLLGLLILVGLATR